MLDFLEGIKEDYKILSLSNYLNLAQIKNHKKKKKLKKHKQTI